MCERERERERETVCVCVSEKEKVCVYRILYISWWGLKPEYTQTHVVVGR